MVEAGENQVGRVAQQERERGVEHVRAGHAEVQVPRGRADALLHEGQERDHVMPRLPLDLVDPRHIRRVHRRQRRRPPLPYRARRLAGDLPQLRHRVRGKRLDLEPDAVAVLRRPDGNHLRPGITGDHERLRNSVFREDNVNGPHDPVMLHRERADCLAQQTRRHAPHRLRQQHMRHI